MSASLYSLDIYLLVKLFSLSFATFVLQGPKTWVCPSEKKLNTLTLFHKGILQTAPLSRAAKLYFVTKSHSNNFSYTKEWLLTLFNLPPPHLPWFWFSSRTQNPLGAFIIFQQFMHTQKHGVMSDNSIQQCALNMKGFSKSIPWRVEDSRQQAASGAVC